MIFVFLIDSCGFSELGESLLTKLLEAMPVRRLDFAFDGASTRGGFAAARCLGVAFAAQLQPNKPLGIGQVIQRARYVTVLWITFPVKSAGCRETIDCVLVPALASCDSPVRRVDVAQSQIIIGLGEFGLSFAKNIDGLLRVSFLKIEPALEDPHDCCHRPMAEF